jgi:Peptidase family M1 domain
MMIARLPTIALTAIVVLVLVVADTTLKGRTTDAGRTTQTRAASGRSPRNASYTIDARLDPARRAIAGTAELAWRNTSPIPAAELRFHLYWNAWRDDESTWMREWAMAGKTSLHDRPPEDRGSINLESIEIDGSNLIARTRFISPDDGNEKDRTVVSVPLEKRVPPGGAVKVRMRWRAQVPRPYSRTGVIGNYFFIAHWFPKIGVLEPGGWNCHQFHAATEFFADFGVYDVRLTVPRGWIVGATGRERGRQNNADGTTTHRYYQEDVHDFAWTTSPDLLVRVERFEYPRLPPVDMRLLLQPEHVGQEARHFDATRAALRYYGEWYGPYPYEHVTIVDPAWQSDSGGMEYPTFFTAGTSWLDAPGTTEPEDVTIHEAGHQFWYGIVANNEFEDAWLDEGLNQFSEARVLDVAYPNRHPDDRFFGGFVPWVYRDLHKSRETDLNYFFAYRQYAEADAQATPTFRYWPGSASAVTYAKTALWLHTLERYIGWPALQRIMSSFFSRWAFRHPKPRDFFAVADEIADQDLRWFFDEVYGSSNAFDYAIHELTSEPEPGGRTFATTVVVRRNGEGVFRLPVRTRFEDGSEAWERWDGRDRWRVLRYTRPARAVSAEVDPDRVLLLDVDRTNNSMTLRPRAAEAAGKWSLVWMAWLQDLLLTWSFFV